MQRRAVAEEADTELLDAVEVVRPARSGRTFPSRRRESSRGRSSDNCSRPRSRTRTRAGSAGSRARPVAASAWSWSWSWSENGSPSCLVSAVEHDGQGASCVPSPSSGAVHAALLEPDLDRVTVGIGDVGVGRPGANSPREMTRPPARSTSLTATSMSSGVVRRNPKWSIPPFAPRRRGARRRGCRAAPGP